MFTQVDTKMVKGFAIVLMLAHHLFLFPERYPIGYSFESIILTDGISLVTVAGAFGKICVSIFMFLGGYGLWCRKDRPSMLQDSVIKLYKAYWKVFLIFIPIGFYFFSNQIMYCQDEAVYGAFSDYSFKHLLANLIGWESEYNQEWWFFKAYLLMLLWGYLYMECVKKIGFWKECFLVMLSVIFIQDIFPGMLEIQGLDGLGNSVWYDLFFLMDEVNSCFLMGIVFARYDGIVKIRDLLNHFRFWIRKLISLAGILLIAYVRYYILGSELDILYVPFIIAFFVELVSRASVIQKTFEILGHNSTNMWLTHSFFCYYFYPFVMLTHSTSNPWFNLLILLALSLGASVGVDLFYKVLWKVMKPVLCTG